MTKDKPYFSNGAEGLPLFEGRMIDHYDYRAKGYRSGRSRAADWQSLEFGNPNKAILPQWHFPRDRVPATRVVRIKQYRIGYGWVSSPTNERSLIAALIPPDTICGNSVPTIIFDHGSSADLLLWLGVANSLTMDFVVRKRVSLNLAYSIVDTFPFPRDWRATPAAEAIIARAYALSAVGQEMAAFRRTAAGTPGIPTGIAPVEDPDIRARLMAEVEVLVAHEVYGLTRDDMRYILDPDNLLGNDCGVETFKALRNRETRIYGEYRTARLVLDAWDRFTVDGTFAEWASAQAVTPLPRPALAPMSLPDDAWARPRQDQRAETTAQLAALVKCLPGPTPIRTARRAIVLTLEPHLLLPHLTQDEAATWRRLIGAEANPPASGVTPLIPRANAAWADAVRHLRGNGYLIENLGAQTWEQGSGLDTFETAGWPDGRARMVLDVFARGASDQIDTSLPNDLRVWVNAAAA
jgi:hypothetical protein